MDNVNSLIGQTIGKYRIMEHLGRGGMAEVYKAFQPALDRYVALKLMHAFLADDQDFIGRFEREAKNVAALRHPNIIQVYDFDVHAGMPYMVMEFIEGGTLKTHLENLARQRRALSLREAAYIITEVGKALDYAHERNMIHRDVKPANILLDSTGRIILTDFGIAKILTGPSHTMTGAAVGTPSYMSPEQGLGKPGDHRSDIYALGVVLYQLSTGQLPYEADTPLAVMLKHVSEPLPLPRSLAPDLPEPVERVILKALAKSPDDRFQSVDDMLHHLADLERAGSLPIPPASMAAGQDAHASTLARAAARAASTPAPLRQPGMAGAGRPGQTPPPPPPPRRPGQAAAEAEDRTHIHAGATLAAPAPPRPIPMPLPKRPARRTPMLLFAAVGILALFLLVGTGAFAVTLGFGRLSRATATQAASTSAPATPVPPSGEAPTNAAPPSATVRAGSSTPNANATLSHALQLTQFALQTAQVTATPSNTPDLTATTLACAHSYELTSQDPADGRIVTVGSRVTKKLTLKNTGACAFPTGVTLVETNPPGGAAALTAEVPAIVPGASAEVSFVWPGATRASTVTRTFEVRLPDGRVIGAPLQLTLKYVVAATAVPTNTPVPTAPPVPPTSAVRKLEDFFPTYSLCQYDGIDFRCSASVITQGGAGPFTLWIEGTHQGTFNLGTPMNWILVWRRCYPAPYNMTVVDEGTGTSMTKGFYFDPSTNGGLFPGGACTLP